MDTVAHAEAVESGLDALIEKRDRQRRKTEGERAAEEMYADSCRRFSDRERTARLWERLRYHEGQARRLSNTVAALVAGHEAEAERYAAILGIAGSFIGDRGRG